jgi:hypothetical protein
MKKYISVILPLFISIACFGQTYKFTPSTKYDLKIAADKNYSDYQIDIENRGSTKLSLTWELVKNTYPSAWDYSLCDYGTCFTVLPQSHTMDSIPIGGSGFMKMNLSPQSTAATGEVCMVIHETSDMVNRDTILFRFTAGALSIVEVKGPNTISLFPNPCTSRLNISSSIDLSGTTVSIHDLKGVEVLSMPFTSAIDTEGLKPGVYLLTMRTKEGLIQRERICRQ